MTPTVRELWNPWTTAFMPTNAPTNVHTLPLADVPHTGASPFVLASLWERDATGTVQRIPLAPQAVARG